MYAASIMFGYFVRRVDKRFQLERGLGLLESGPSSDAISRLERLFAQVRPVLCMDIFVKFKISRMVLMNTN